MIVEQTINHSLFPSIWHHLYKYDAAELGYSILQSNV